MWLAPVLKMRDKIARKRLELSVDTEKPFLDHLEDLRKTITRLMTTLIAAVIACYVFHPWFFKVVEYPAGSAGLLGISEPNLPAGITLKDWKRIHDTARQSLVLEGPQRDQFIESALPDSAMRPWVRAFQYYHAGSLLPADAKSTFYDSVFRELTTDSAGPIRTALDAMEAAAPSPSIEPLKPAIVMSSLKPTEGFMASMKLSFFAGIVVSFPLLFYFLLEFILPGLTPKERRLIWPSLGIGFGLFLAGVAFAFFVVVPKALGFFHAYSANLGIRDEWRVGEYISFVTRFTLIFGVSFELPVVVMALVKLGLLESATMRRTRAWAVIIIVAVGAILTPTPDAFTLLLLSGPMVIMYEGCIWLAVWLEKKGRAREAEEEAREGARRAALVGVAGVQAAAPALDGGPPGDPEPNDEPDPPDDPGPLDEYEIYRREHEHLFPPENPEPDSTPRDPSDPSDPSDPGSPFRHS